MNDPLLIFSLSILITGDNNFKNKANDVLFIVSYCVIHTYWIQTLKVFSGFVSWPGSSLGRV